MMQKIVVYLGPSLPKTDALNILEAEYLPPAKRGDIPLAVREGAKIICLIDGVFFQDCATGHREILSALRRGVRVIGASSMGALRASELDTLGMEGIGEIYRLYKEGEITSDDEVALIFDPESYHALSVPLVNVRYVLMMAEKEGVITPEEGELIFARARSLYFPERTWERIQELTYNDVNGEIVDHFIDFARTGPDLKREDAVKALHYTRRVARELDLLE
jgi:TfuA protein